MAPTPAPTAPPVTGPKITSYSITGPTSCPATDVSVSLPPVPVKLTWTATGADSVYIAIGNPDGPYATGLPLSGSYELPSPCPGPFSQTYYIVAVKGAQKDVKSKTISSNS
ncbi:MAG TPA: hypothetical protein DCR14_05555 [Acidimicrobiaceae bacterium]|nr:hypothetical protein [Acidimicrobiaceae bacterium]